MSAGSGRFAQFTAHIRQIAALCARPARTADCASRVNASGQSVLSLLRAAPSSTAQNHVGRAPTWNGLARELLQ
jgi:hypothetical protein